jgi:hypothetical protein
MYVVRRKVVWFIALLVCFLALVPVWLAVADSHPDPSFLEKFGGTMVSENRLFDQMQRDYEVKGDAKEIVREMKRELIAKGWKVEEGSVLASGSGWRSMGKVWFFQKGAETFAFEQLHEDSRQGKHNIVLLREMSWLERQWHEALIKVGLRNRYSSDR